MSDHSEVVYSMTVAKKMNAPPKRTKERVIVRWCPIEIARMRRRNPQLEYTDGLRHDDD